MRAFPVIILAGGLATRLRPLTETIPKSLVDIHGEPFIAHQLRLLKKQGIHHVVLCVGYLGDKLQEFVGCGEQFGIQVDYSFDGEKLLGTAGALKKALSLVENNFFVLYGDSYLPCHYQDVQQVFIQKNKPALMTVFRNQGKWDSSNVEFVDGNIKVYDKKNRTEKMNYIDYGLGIFNKHIFDCIPDNENYDLAIFYQYLLQQNQLAAYEVKERFYEAGSFAGILELENYLSKNKELSCNL